ncbi:MAG: O-methyltransferase [Planctomycetes bacterium]|nr:O-methyltransferase [Planctomycetota bacterium]MCW8134784.1 O-methyltransferase [Planctomycetota bacterium]
MSEPCPVTRRHLQYVADRTRADDDFLVDLKAAAKAADIPSISIGAAQASLMQIALKAARAVNVVEVGCLAGYSAIQMARALPPNGRVRTIELEPRHAAFAREWIAKSNVAGKVEVIQGAGVDVLKTFASDSADAAFLDADKENYPKYLDECLRIVKRGGLIMADNAFAFGQLFADVPDESGVHAVRRFNDYMAAKPGLHGVIAPIGDGCWIAVKE